MTFRTEIQNSFPATGVRVMQKPTRRPFLYTVERFANCNFTADGLEWTPLNTFTCENDARRAFDDLRRDPCLSDRKYRIVKHCVITD